MLVQRKKQKRFNVILGKRQIEEFMQDLPNDTECYKFLSDGGFSSICFILFVAERAKINNLLVSTFRVGKKEIQLLNALHEKGRLDNATFVCMNLMKEDASTAKYGHYNILDYICKKNEWGLQTKRNHSKVILLDTDKGKFVIETSSNLNENPKIEQFSFEKDAELYDFYKRELFCECDTQ